MTVSEIKQTNTQRQAIKDITGQLIGNHSTPSPFKEMEIQGSDLITGSLRVLISYEEHTARVWIGKGGQVRDLDGMVLSKKYNGVIRMIKNPPSVYPCRH